MTVAKRNPARFCLCLRGKGTRAAPELRYTAIGNKPPSLYLSRREANDNCAELRSIGRLDCVSPWDLTGGVTMTSEVIG